MRRTLSAAMAAAWMLAGVGAQASDTFGLTAHLGGWYQYAGGASGVPGGCDRYGGTAYYDACFYGGMIPVSGDARLTVTTESGTDGTYTGDTLDQVTYTGPYDAFVFNKGDVPVPNDLGFGYPLLGAEPGASVTIRDGAVSAISITYDLVFAQVFVGGLSILDHGTTSSQDASGWFLTGRAVRDVPEPAQPLMLLAGLCMLAYASVARRTGRCLTSGSPRSTLLAPAQQRPGVIGGYRTPSR